MMTTAAQTKTTTNNQADLVIFIPREEVFCGAGNVTEASTHDIIKKCNKKNVKFPFSEMFGSKLS
jgi:hypothetical protein